ncbi:MipA/OmpV family protein [Serratia sp. NPDC078593]|uniref:MipA/OmpV family protein n=1 Tax=unclassified Serratia (in: enterobacteria) TaxID=2647522 RepID=UPI0037CEE007
MEKDPVKKTQLKTLAIIVTAMMGTHSAQAGTWSLGASALVSPDPYRGYQTRVYPVPVINYEADDFYFRTLTAGYYLWNDRENKLSVMAYYSPLHYKPGDSDDDRMKRLDKRRGTLMAGVAYSHNADWGTIRATFSGDTLDNSNGLIGDVAYLYKFNFDTWSLTPGVGVTWNSKNQNKYYYGVSDHESRRSGLNSYTPDDSWAPYLELTANYQINNAWNTFVMGRYIQLSDEIKDSPMVDKSYTGVLWTGVSYSF